MNARRPRLWWGFALGAGAVLAALAWASLAVYRLETRNAQNRALAQRQDVIRRALWRVDSQVAPIIALEAARPLSPGRDTGFTRSARTAVPTLPAIDGSQAFADGYFVIDPAGEVYATDGRTNDIALQLSNPAPSAQPEAAEPEETRADAEPERPNAEFDYAAREQVANIAKREPQQFRQRSPRQQTPTEENAFAELADSAIAGRAAERDEGNGLTGISSLLKAAPSAASDRSIADIGQTVAEWVEGTDGSIELVFYRSVRTDEGERAEGVRLDWPGLRDSLVTSVEDLLPGSQLIPARGPATVKLERDGNAYRLATIPALLVPGPFPVTSATSWMTPALWALLVTWVAMLMALVAVGMVLRATLRLSDRRARFVGAVTHELRTPLTTFRLYAQMLAGGMVTEENARREYLGTLERESIRLGEIVENVLEYARLTRRRPGDARPPGERPITPSELLARVRPVLSRRAEQSGMDLIVSIDPSAESGRLVTCDPRSVERILMNLVENACKYAAPHDSDPELATGPESDPDADTRIHLDLGLSDRALEILVSDHGPGVPRRERERVFGEFHRGPGAAEGSRPGLGLGLALSRGLARETGGDLRLVRRRGHGAEFLLTIPLDPA